MSLAASLASRNARRVGASAFCTSGAVSWSNSARVRRRCSFWPYDSVTFTSASAWDERRSFTSRAAASSRRVSPPLASASRWVVRQWSAMAWS